MNKERKIWFWVFIAVAAMIFVALPIMSKTAGNSGDEDGFQIPYANQVCDYYASAGKDKTCLANEDMGMHGGWFDPLTVALTKAFNIEEPANFRHICNSLIGCVGILFAGLLAKYISGKWHIGIISMILLFFSPRYLGHSFNNPKDLIFAATMIAGLYYVFRFVKEYPKPKISTSIGLTIFATLSFVSRFAGLLLFAYLVLFLVIQYILLNKKAVLRNDNLKIVGKYFVWIFAIVVVTFLFSIAMWPYLMDAPFKNLAKILTEMSQYAVSIRQVFEGSLQWSDALPWYYTIKLLFLTTPMVVLLGIISFFAFSWIKKEERFSSFYLFFVFFFPIFWIIFTKANVYGGIRHILFAYPPICVAAAVGFGSFENFIEEKLLPKFTKAENSVTKYAFLNLIFVVLSILLAYQPIRHIVKNHPYEYVYFNELSGGIDKMYGNYEMDYYYHSTREASEWILNNVKPNNNGEKIKVATWHTASVNYFFRKDTANYKPVFSRWYEKGNNDWDYAIFTVTGMSPEQIKNAKFFPPNDCVHTINVDRKPICLILKRKSKDDFIGNALKNEQKTDSAVVFLKNSLEQNPSNEAVLNNLIEIYFAKGDVDSAKIFIDKELEQLPNFETPNYYLANYYLSKGDAQNAIKSCKKLIDINFKFNAAYKMLASIYLQQNDFRNAEKTLTQLIDINQLDNESAQLLLQIYSIQGLDQRGAYKKLYKKLVKSFEKQGKKKEAAEYRKLYEQL